jgi:hypothetical protein
MNVMLAEAVIAINSMVKPKLVTEKRQQNNMTVIHHPPYFSLFPQLKIKLKGRHFDTNEVIEAE